MSLVDRIAEETGLPKETAGKAAGSLLAAIRLSLSAKEFEPVAIAIPDYNQLMSSAGAALGGRTGEVFALRSELRTATGAGHLAKELVKHGVPASKFATFAGAFLGTIQDIAGAEAVGRLREALPGLNTLFE